MTREVISAAVNTTVSHYMRQRALKPSIPRALEFQPNSLEDNDPIDFVMDPLGRVSRHILDQFLRKELRSFIQEEVTEMTGKGTVGNDYLVEAFFIPFFS